MMKRLLLVFLFLSSVAISMDKFEAIAYVQRQAEQQRRDKLGYELGSYIWDIIERRSSNITFTQEERAHIKALLAQGANINRNFIYHEDESSRVQAYPLFLVVSIGDNEIIKEFIDHGADLEIKDYFGTTPLMRAVQNGSVEAVRMLTDGSLVERQQLKEIAKHGQGSYLSLLPSELKGKVFNYRKVGSNPNARDNQGRTALNMAIELLEGYISDPQRFLDLNVNVNQKIRIYEEIISILEPITSKEQPQPQQSWWKRWVGRP